MSDHRFSSWLTALAALTAAASLTPAGEICVPPPNEDCESSVVFSNADLPYEVTAPLGCVNDEIDKPYFDVFYRFDCTETGNYLVHMCGSTGDTYLRIYGDGCGWGDGFEYAVADDECPGSPPLADPLLLVNLQAGQSYWFELGAWRPDPPFAPPPNAPYLFSVALEADPPGPAGSLDVDAGPERQLQIAKDGVNLTLSWGLSCVLDDTDYAVYQGRIAALGLHAPLSCSTAGATSYTTHAPDDDVYFLVTARNGFVGGSYGTMSSGGQRSQGSPACVPRFWTTCP
jgi:hypothetical protein